MSYCTVDPYFDKVFCYICRNHENKELECHAFLCSKKSKAEAITLTVAQAFNIAFERWQAHKKRKESQKKAREDVKTAAATLANASTSNGAPPQQTRPDLGESLPFSVSHVPLEVTPIKARKNLYFLSYDFAVPTSGEELKTPSPLPVPIIAPPTVIEPSPLDNMVEGMAATKIEISPPTQPKKVWFSLSLSIQSLLSTVLCVYNFVCMLCWSVCVTTNICCIVHSRPIHLPRLMTHRLAYSASSRPCQRLLAWWVCVLL